MSTTHPTDVALSAPAWFRNFAGYLTAAALCIGILTWILELWRVDLAVPFTYAADSLFYEMLVQSTVENGWYLHNDRLGAPYGLDMRDFPLADSLHFAIVRLIGFATPDPIVAFNVFFLLTFPLTTVIALFVLRRFGLSYGPALVASLLYAFLPYHLLRNCQLFFAAYYLVPLMVLVVVWLQRDALLRVREGEKPRLLWASGKFLGSVLICLLMSCGGVYYAFFGCAFLIVAGVMAALSRKATAPLWAGGLLCTAIVLGGLVNGIPYLQARLENGKNAEGLRRSPAGAELYGLKVAQLLLPVTNHRVPMLARGKALYNEKMPLVTENDHSSLGALGALGFVVLIGCLLVRRRGEGPPALLEALSKLNLFAVLVGAIGGFGFFVCLAMPEIRSFNRISVYIGFFALAALAICLDRVKAGFAGTHPRKAAFAVLLALLVVAGVLDQTPNPLPYFDRQEEFRQDAAFIKEIENMLPAGALVFQLPYVPFPENPPVQQMTDYDHLRGGLHSRTLKWSYPTMRGRWGDTWQRAIAQKRVDELLPALALAGFSGIYIDRFGFADRAADLEQSLQRALGHAPTTSADGRLAFFNLTEYVAELRQQVPDTRWQALRQQVLTLHAVSFPPLRNERQPNAH